MLFRAAIYLLFFFSGLSALIYQVLWVRSFSLIFGGSHMAVTTVLSVFMGGLALGGYLGRHTDRTPRPLRLYGLLEIGIGAAALLLFGLLTVYPEMYVAFARMVGNQFIVLNVGRVLFAIVALLVPTTLMGLTLPALAGFAGLRQGSLGKHLSFLYGINTLGAVLGAISAGFFLLGHLTINATYGLAISISLLVGAFSLIIDKRISALDPADGTAIDEAAEGKAPGEEPTYPSVPAAMILTGIGISGFCALGYEVLWTRVLSIVVGTTVYGYTLMLVAFLTGIALGGASYRLFLRFIDQGGQRFARAIMVFGLIQVTIGLLALLVSHTLRDLPNQALKIESSLHHWFGAGANVLQATNFLLAIAYMLVPAFFMGLAFPLAGDIVARARGKVGKAVGETLTCNTIGAILGAAISGFLLIYLFGVERSLQLLSLTNLGLGMAVCATRLKTRVAPWGAIVFTLAVMIYLAANPNSLRIWNAKYFAIFNHNARQVFSNEEQREDIFESSEVLYYAEGTTSTISVVKIKGANQGINVNGRTVASTARQDQQCQYTLGHLPMLLHKNPRKVWVLGMGTGMTAGATSVHPEVESVTVVELEKHVLPAARTFAAYNHDFLDDPKVNVVFNDGRNYLLTTEDRFDVMTADPIHPWSQGAAYLYTDEYYRLAASRLKPGGIMCQWLPIYELTPSDLKSVVKTFANNFRYVYVWLTDYDAELIGSNDPIEINIDDLQKRIEASPAVLSDLRKVNMGSAADFLSYGIMGPAASRAYGEGARLNTDNNLYLEFSAPKSKGRGELVAINLASLSDYREELAPYISGQSLSTALGTDLPSLKHATMAYDRAHMLYYQGQVSSPAYADFLATLEHEFPWYAPGQYLRQEYQKFLSMMPVLIDEIQLVMAAGDGTPVVVILSAVSIKIGPERIKLSIVDNRARRILGDVYIDGPADEIDSLVAEKTEQMFGLIGTIYQQEKNLQAVPDASRTMQKIETALARLDSKSS